MPASVVPTDLKDAYDLLKLDEVKRRFTAIEPPVYVRVSDPYYNDPVAFRIG